MSLRPSDIAEWSGLPALGNRPIVEDTDRLVRPAYKPAPASFGIQTLLFRLG